MACKLEDDPLFYVLGGVARDRRAEIGDAADLKHDPVFAAACCLVGLAQWDDEPAPEGRMKRSRSIIESMRPIAFGDE